MCIRDRLATGDRDTGFLYHAKHAYTDQKYPPDNPDLSSADDSGCGSDLEEDRKSTRLNSSHITRSRMPSSA